MVLNHTKLLIFILLIIIKHELAKAQDIWLYDSSEDNKALLGFVMASVKVELGSCITMCKKIKNCASINFDLTSLTCDLNRATKRAYPEKIVERGNTIYMDKGVEQDWVRVQATGCGQYDTFNVTGPGSGYIWSPYFPSRTPNDLNCHWKLTSNADIGIQFIAFSTEECCDKVRIFSSPTSPLGEFSGEAMPKPSKFSKALNVTFTTDGSQNSQGFLAHFLAGSRN